MLNSQLIKANLIAPLPSLSTQPENKHERHVVTNCNPTSSFAKAPRRVFQILANSPARKVLFTWPPSPSLGGQAGGEERGLVGAACAYDASQFGKLASNVRIDSPVQSATASPASSSEAAAATTHPDQAQSLHTHTHKLNRPSDPDSTYAEVKTSCTRRYRSQQTFHSGGVLNDVESIFIPHGSVIFACHQVVSSQPYISSSSSLNSSASTFAPATSDPNNIPSSSLFKPQSQAWTLKPSSRPIVPPLSSLVQQYSPPSASTSASTMSFLNSSISPFSSAFPVTPASAGGDNRDRAWPATPGHAHDSWSHQHHQISANGFSSDSIDNEGRAHAHQTTAEYSKGAVTTPPFFPVGTRC